MKRNKNVEITFIVYNTSKYCYNISKFQYSYSWSAGWTTIKPFTLDGQPHLLGYKNEDGTVAIDKINAGGEGTTEVWRGTGSSNIVTRNAQMLFP